MKSVVVIFNVIIAIVKCLSTKEEKEEEITPRLLEGNLILKKTTKKN